MICIEREEEICKLSYLTLHINFIGLPEYTRLLRLFGIACEKGINKHLSNTPKLLNEVEWFV